MKTLYKTLALVMCTVFWGGVYFLTGKNIVLTLVTMVVLLFLVLGFISLIDKFFAKDYNIEKEINEGE